MFQHKGFLSGYQDILGLCTAVLYEKTGRMFVTKSRLGRAGLPDPCQHPCRLPPQMLGFSHGLKNSPPDCFLPRLRRGRPFESHYPLNPRNKNQGKSLGFCFWQNYNKLIQCTNKRCVNQLPDTKADSDFSAIGYSRMKNLNFRIIILS